jgi:hypothetical protein
MRKAKHAEARWGVDLLAALCAWLVLMTSAIAGPTARIAQSGEVLELDYHGDGRSYTDTIPLYRTGEVQYFSAGVGVEERSAAYPPFPLKLIFTAGGKSYVAGVSVTVRQSNGTTVVTIPAEQITGPWLFLDLPDGSYHIEATLEGRTERREDIRIERGTQKTLYVRWSDDREPLRDTKAK